MLEGKTFWITGSTGRLGVDLTHRIESLGGDVCPLVLGSYPAVPKRVAWKSKAKLLRVESREDLQKLKSPDYVIHCHWEVKRALPFLKQISYEVEHNIERLGFLWEFLADCEFKKFVFLSSIKIFGERNKEPISSQTAPLPSTPYGITKVMGEHFFDNYFQNKTPVTHLRLSSVASPGENPTQLMSRLYQSAFQGEKIKIYSESMTYLYYIEEAVDLILSAALTPSETRYNLVPRGYKNREIAALFEEATGKKLNAEYIETPGSNLVFKPEPNPFHAEWVRSASLLSILKRGGFQNPVF
jgi:UDP-glucose 4-epimerase